jgi:hypothetical protein
MMGIGACGLYVGIGRVSTMRQTKDTGEKTTKGPLFTVGGAGGPGRPKMVDNREYISAIKQGFPPERIVELLNEAIDIACRTHSWRGVVAAAEFAAAYSLGKPKQTIQATGNDSLADLLANVDADKPLLPDPTTGTTGTADGTADGVTLNGTGVTLNGTGVGTV